MTRPIEPSHTPAKQPNLLKVLIGVVLDFIRWTQLTPMITVWGFGLLMLGAIILINHAETIFDAVAMVAEWIAGLPYIGEAFIQKMESLADDGDAIPLGGKGLEAAILRIWGLMSLGFLIISVIIGWLFGPFRPWTLKRKLFVLILCCLAYWVLLAAAYFLDSSEFNGPAISWLGMFLGVSTLLLVVSAWSLSVAHLLSLIRRLVDESSIGEPKFSGPEL